MSKNCEAPRNPVGLDRHSCAHVHAHKSAATMGTGLMKTQGSPRLASWAPRMKLPLPAEPIVAGRLSSGVIIRAGKAEHLEATMRVLEGIATMTGHLLKMTARS